MGRHRKQKLLAERQDGETTPMQEVLDAAGLALAASTDQTCAKAASMGRIAGAYYMSLRAAGLPEALAGQMTGEYGSMLCSLEVYGAPTMEVMG